MRVEIIASDVQDITKIIKNATWSGSRLEVARKFEMNLIQDDRDPQCPLINFDNGYTVRVYDDNGGLIFEGNIYKYRRSRADGNVYIMCWDHLHVLKVSKMTKSYKNALPEDIAVEMCKLLGVKVGNIAKTGITVSFIANAKTGYQIIQMAYTEAHKKDGKIYQQVMNGSSLDIIIKGEMLDFSLDSRVNMTNSEYEESIERLINRVAILDDHGDILSYQSDEESIKRYSMFQTILKNDPNKDMAAEAGAIFKDNKVKRSGYITAIGDYRVISGYSINVTDGLFNGQFWIKQDSHTFKEGQHEMKLELEFENEMNEEKVPEEKNKKKTKESKRQRK